MLTLAQALLDPLACTSLDLSVGQTVAAVPDEIAALQNLESLRIGRDTKKISEAIGDLPKLRKLVLWGDSPAKVLPDTIGNLGALEELSIAWPKLAAFPATLGRLGSLRKLSLAHPRLTALPDSICELSSLGVLALHMPRLAALPDGIGRLLSLERLLIDEASLTTLPASVGRLERLTHLAIGGNKLSEIPPAAGGLTALRYVKIAGARKLKRLPSECAEWTQVQVFWTDDVGFKEVPEPIFAMKGLRSLAISNGALKKLSPRIGELAELAFLKLENNWTSPAGNAIAEVPKELLALDRLVQLDLRFNLAESFPAALGGLASVRFLGLPERMPQAEVDRVAAAFPGAEIHQGLIDWSEGAEIVAGLNQLAWGSPTFDPFSPLTT